MSIIMHIYVLSLRIIYSIVGSTILAYVLARRPPIAFDYITVTKMTI